MMSRSERRLAESEQQADSALRFAGVSSFFPVLPIGADGLARGRSQSSVARSAIRRTRAQRAHFTVTLRGERISGTEDGPGPVLQARSSAQRYGGYRRPAESEAAYLVAASRP